MNILNYKLFLSTSILLGLYTCTYAQNSTVKVDQDPQIDKLLEYKKDIRTVDVYKIQIFSGDRIGAERTRNSFANQYNDFQATLEFNTPNYKVWIGNFTNRLEAERALVKIKKEYVNAFIFKPKISLKS